MDVPTSEVGYTIATTRRETTKVRKNVWWHWTKTKKEFIILLYVHIQGDQKVSMHLTIKIQKVTSNVQSVPRQSPDIY